MESTERRIRLFLLRTNPSLNQTYKVGSPELVMQLMRQPIEAWQKEKHYSKENNIGENQIPKQEIPPVVVNGI